MVNRKWSLGLVGILLFFWVSSLTPASAIQNALRNDPVSIQDSTGYELQTLWNGTAINRIWVHEEKIVIQNGTNEIILLENERFITKYTSPTRIDDLDVLSKGIVFITNQTFWVLPYDNFSIPTDVFNISSDVTYIPCTRNLAAYQNLVYNPCYEFGGYLVYNFSDIHNPRRVAQFSISWHAFNIQIVDNVAFLVGDTTSGIYNLSTNPFRPVAIWTTDWYYPHSLSAGSDFYFAKRPTINDEFIVFRTFSSGGNELYLIPRENKTTYGFPTKYAISEDQGFRDSVFIQDPNIVLITGQNNMLFIFKITRRSIPKPQTKYYLGKERERSQSLKLRPIMELYLGAEGEIEDIYFEKNTNFLYIAAGSQGLLKMNLSLLLPFTATPDLFNELVPILAIFPIVLGAVILVLRYLKRLK